MSENPTYSMVLRATTSATPAEAVGGSSPNPVAIDHGAVLAAMRLRPRQRTRILGEHAQQALPTTSSAVPAKILDEHVR